VTAPDRAPAFSLSGSARDRSRHAPVSVRPSRHCRAGRSTARSASSRTPACRAQASRGSRLDYSGTRRSRFCVPTSRFVFRFGSAVPRSPSRRVEGFRRGRARSDSGPIRRRRSPPCRGASSRNPRSRRSGAGRTRPLPAPGPDRRGRRCGGRLRSRVLYATQPWIPAAPVSMSTGQRAARIRSGWREPKKRRPAEALEPPPAVPSRRCLVRTSAGNRAVVCAAHTQDSNSAPAEGTRCCSRRACTNRSWRDRTG